jgi:hypothetical protein
LRFPEPPGKEELGELTDDERKATEAGEKAFD